MLITNFFANGSNLFTLWDGKQNVKAWKTVDSMPKCYRDDARVCMRVAVTRKQYAKLSEKLLENV